MSSKTIETEAAQEAEEGGQGGEAPLAAGVRDKYDRLRQGLGGTEGLLVAFSGGVDSAVLLAVAREAHRGRVLAVTLSSVLQPRDEVVQAQRLARQVGVEHRVVESRPLEDEALRRNRPDRCYLCKRSIMLVLGELARREGVARIVEGSNRDDEGDFRPGRRALREHRVSSPLLEAGLSKGEVRALGRWLGLSNWDQPALACLASRVPYGEELTEERLRRIGQAEAWCRAAGWGQVRVRDHGSLARVEVLPEEINRLTEQENRAALVAALKQAGYAYVTVDLEGYRTGAMNEVLSVAERTGPDVVGAVAKDEK